MLSLKERVLAQKSAEQIRYLLPKDTILKVTINELTYIFQGQTFEIWYVGNIERWRKHVKIL